MNAVDWAQVDAEQVTAVQDDDGVLWTYEWDEWTGGDSGDKEDRLIGIFEVYGITAWRDTSMQWHQLAMRGESGRWHPVDGATLPPMREKTKRSGASFRPVEDDYNVGATCCGGECGLGLCYVDQITGESE